MFVFRFVWFGFVVRKVRKIRQVLKYTYIFVFILKAARFTSSRIEPIFLGQQSAAKASSGSCEHLSVAPQQQQQQHSSRTNSLNTTEIKHRMTIGAESDNDDDDGKNGHADFTSEADVPGVDEHKQQQQQQQQQRRQIPATGAERDETENDEMTKITTTLKLTICEQHLEKSANSLSRSFKLLIDDLILSISPFVAYQMPFLLLINNINSSNNSSENSSNSQLRKYLPDYFYEYTRSSILMQDNRLVQSSMSDSSHNSTQAQQQQQQQQQQLQQLHNFLLVHLTKTCRDDAHLRRLYADYRSRGGIASLRDLNAQRSLLLGGGGGAAETSAKTHTSPTKAKQTHASAQLSRQRDCLDVFNRQHLVVLFCTQCETSPVYPNACHRPRLIDMQYYGENDMTPAG